MILQEDWDAFRGGPVGEWFFETYLPEVAKIVRELWDECLEETDIDPIELEIRRRSLIGTLQVVNSTASVTYEGMMQDMGG